MLTVIENTYEGIVGIANAIPGDRVEWRRSPGRWNLHRIADDKVVFSMDCRSDGLKPNGKEPVLVGVIAQVKKYGFRLVIEEVR